MHYTSTMTTKGQVTIPLAIRNKLGLRPGQTVRFNLSGATAKIEQDTWQEDMAVLHARVREHLTKNNIKPMSDEELDEAINTAASNGATENHLRKNK